MEKEKIKQKYLLKGDINGIQKYIFDVQNNGAAKSLKAKSFLIEEIGSVACEKILTELKSFDVNGTIFYEGGGSFYIWFDAEDDFVANNIMNKIRDDFHKALKYEKFYITLSFVKADKQDFGATWINLREQSIKDQLQIFISYSSAFTPYSLDDETISNLQSKEIGVNTNSDIYKAITNEMVKHNYFFISLFGEKEVFYVTNFENIITNKLPFWEDYKEKESYKKYRLNHQYDYPDNFILEDNNLIDFDAFGDFAAHRTGTNKIGVAKLDVDNLGQLFGNIGNETEGEKLSEALNNFFKESLYTIFSKETLKWRKLDEDDKEDKEVFKANIYPVFAGGDDCFIIGAWDAVLPFIKRLQEKFHDEQNRWRNEFIKKEEDVTLSAGIVIVDPTCPVKLFAEMAENALSKAKKSGKNKIVLFDQVFSWKDYEVLLDTSAKLASYMQQNNIDRAYLNKITKSAKGFNALNNNNGVNFDNIYKLKYYISKNDETLNYIAELLFDPYYEAMKNRLLNHEADLNIAIYPTIARITELLTKSKLAYE
ncbi:type III-A CRISPR-associated protein Cas10/Csm1 [Seramator thermalis]|uniref:type III-A CRISPR-associated protein Cas10/Csm1 n=1 Tax=Seramator thermalis TaxID=2496270 RepID=UPI00101CA4BD|nr:hypothetical protein [Seramator thermalis]